MQILNRQFRDRLALLLLLLGAGLAVMVLVAPGVLVSQPVLVFSGLLLAAIILLGRKSLRVPPISLIVTVMAAALALPFVVVYRAFGQVDMISFLFHAKAGITGVSPWMLRDEIMISLCALTSIILISYLLSSRPKLRHLPLVTAALLVLSNPFVVFQAKLLLQPVPDVDLAATVVTPQIAENPLPPDIVYIYLEGLDRRFLDPDIAPETAKVLHKLEAQGLSFTALLDGVRRDAALQAVTDSTRALADIGLALGFAEPAVFWRAFRRWTGCTPQAWRDSPGDTGKPGNRS